MRLRGSFAPKRSAMMRAHSRRAARNFAISSKKCMWQAKKNDRRGATSSTSSPASSAACTYAMPFASVNATSCTAVAPGLAHVVAADRDRVPLRDALAAVGEQIRDEAHRGLRWVDVGPSGRVLLQQVVLHRPREPRGLDAPLLGHELVQEQQDRRGGVDRHRRRDPVERDALEQQGHVLDRVDRDARCGRPRPRRAGGPSPGPSAWGGRMRPTGPSGRARAGSGSGRWSRRRFPCPRTGASSTAGRGTWRGTRRA